MAIWTISKKLNVSPYAAPLVIQIKQYTSDFALKLQLYSTVGDLDIPAGATTKIRGTKRDGNGYELTGTRIGHTCTFSGTKEQMQQMTAAHGRCVFEVVVENETKELITANFYLEVQRAAMDAGTVTSESIIEEFADFQSKITAAQAAATAAQEQADRAEAAAESVDFGLDPVPTQGSTNAVSSGGVYSALAGKVDAVTGKGLSTNDYTNADKQAVTDATTDLSAMTSATAEDVGKALKAKTVNGGKVTEWEFGEAGGADPEVIEQAVTDWLDEHPEATTTVQDGSITEAKLAPALIPTLKNDYVTPEMFGAVGDGVADDTQALKAMFATSDKKYVFASKTYKISDSVDIGHVCSLYFTNTTIQVTRDLENARAFDYMIGIKAKVATSGNLTLNCDRSVNIGLWLSACGGSKFENINIHSARVWGVCIDPASAGNNSLLFEKISCVYCGLRFTAKAKYISNSQYEITELSNTNTSRWNYSAFSSAFESSYSKAKYIIDDSGYTAKYLYNRLVAGTNASTPITIDQETPTSGIFSKSGSSAGLSSDYKDGENGLPVIIPVGGAVCFESSASEGVYRIESFVSQNNAIAFYAGMSYGGYIESFASEYDGVLIVSPITYALTINYLYLEALGTGFQYKFGNAYDRIMLICANENTSVIINNPFIGTSRIKFYQANEVLLVREKSQNDTGILEALFCPDVMAENAFNNPYIDAAGINLNIDEWTPRRFTHSARYLSSDYTIRLNLKDINSYRRNQFGPFEYYVKIREPQRGNVFKVTLHSDLITAGYSIEGAIDNVLSIDGSSYNNLFKVIIFLMDKTFYVVAEALAPISNTV